MRSGNVWSIINGQRTYIKDATKLFKADKSILGDRIFRDDHNIRSAK